MVSGSDFVIIGIVIVLLVLFGKKFIFKGKDTVKTAVVETAKLSYEIGDELKKVREERQKIKDELNVTENVKTELKRSKKKQVPVTEEKQPSTNSNDEQPITVTKEV